uniref:Golgi transport 1A n=1 Tax=Sphaeramia orbicularis TaxID=375764 RepID=A0A673ABW0_9TELE
MCGSDPCVCLFPEVGIGLMGFGLFFLVFGVLFYFDSVLLAFGNILFLSGLAFIIGFRRTAHFFFQRHKFRGSLFFLGGVALVLCRWPIIGMLVESYGFVLLFRKARCRLLHKVRILFSLVRIYTISPACIYKADN